MAKEKKQEKKSEKKSSSGIIKKMFLVILALGCLLAAGVVGFIIGNEDSRDNIENAGEKVSEVGERLGEWGRDVSKSTKKLFD